MRVHELAKELGAQSKDLIAEIEKLGGSVKNHMSLVDEKIVGKIRAAKKSAPVKKAAVPASALEAAPKPSAKKAAPAPKSRCFPRMTKLIPSARVSACEASA